MKLRLIKLFKRSKYVIGIFICIFVILKKIQVRDMYRKLDCFFNVPENARLMESNWHVMYNVGCWRKYNISNSDFSCFRSKLEGRGIVFLKENSYSDGWFRIKPFDDIGKGVWADFYMKNFRGEIDEMYLVFYDPTKNEMFITYTTDNPIDAPIYESR